MEVPLQIRRTVPATPAAVWEAFTDPVALTAWFDPPRLTVEIDNRIGGRYHLRSDSLSVDGTLTEIDAPRRLALDWRHVGATAHTCVVVTLLPTRTGTEIRLTHDGFVDTADRDSHAQVWTAGLDRLSGWLATLT